ncbi:hypothetical protein [Rhizobium sp. RCAM05973]|nr:hypothetical protein [Rhizobium sp. RCAM05973]
MPIAILPRRGIRGAAKGIKSDFIVFNEHGKAPFNAGFYSH